MAVPTSSGTQNKPPCARIGLFKRYAGIDLPAMYPATPVHTPASDTWTYDALLKAAEACHKAGFPFALGLSATTDCVDMVGAMFAAFGAVLVDGEGNLKVRSDTVREVLESPSVWSSSCRTT
jgi:hypothetical protein